MDLMKKLERVLDLLIVVLERQANPLTVVAAAPAPAAGAAEPKKRTKKEPAAPVPPAPVEPPTGDPLMQAEVTAPAAAPATAPAGAVVYTEAESAAKAAELAKNLCNAFPEKEANNRPKGFRLALDLLAKHKVARTTDLVHAQRLQFIVEAEAILKTVPAAA